MTFAPVDPEHDRLQTISTTPGWSENLVVQTHDSRADVAVWAHWSRIPGAPHIWEGVIAVYLPNGELLVSRSFGPSPPSQSASSGPLAFRCVEPGYSWQLRFDGMVRRTTSAEVGSATLHDGQVERLTVELEFAGVHPLWSAHGNMADQSWATAHLEQGGQIKGQLNVSGKATSVDAVGFRDHSYGPRNYSGMSGNTWCSAVTPSGRAVLGLNVWQESGPALSVGFVWDGNEMHDATAVQLPKLRGPAGEPLACVAEIVTPRGVEQLEVTQLHRMTWTLDEPIGMTAGARGDDAMRVIESPARIVWDGEVAAGWIEKNLRPSSTSPFSSASQTVLQRGDVVVADDQHTALP